MVERLLDEALIRLDTLGEARIAISVDHARAQVAEKVSVAPLGKATSTGEHDARPGRRQPPSFHVGPL